MSRALVDTICQSLPGSEWTDAADGGIPSWKVGGKMFACVGSRGEGVSVKTPDVETAALLIEVGRAERAPYFHRSWVRIGWGSVPEAELRDRILTSYTIVRAGLPKKLRDSLGPAPAV